MSDFGSRDDERSYFDSMCELAETLKEDLAAAHLKRDTCEKCERPKVVCLCSYLPDLIPLKRKIKVWIFQHPCEEKRCLRTTRILEKSLGVENFEILKAKFFTTKRFPELESVYSNPNTVVLYPSDLSMSLNEYRKQIETNDKKIDGKEVENESFFHIIVIDGTWSQASGIFNVNPILQSLKQIKIDSDFKSAYTIRTQPREFFLSTLETVAVILSTLEENPKIYDDLVKPLRALCEFQFEYGAQPHHSKEFLIFNGEYKKPINQKNMNKITKDSVFLNEENKDEISKIVVNNRVYKNK